MKNNISLSPVDTHYEQLLGLTPPWRVKDVAIDTTALTVIIRVETQGTSLSCPECQCPCPLYDHREERNWRHLDTMQFTTTIVARIPRIECKEHGIISVTTPWANDLTRFTLLFEHFAIDVLQAAASLTQAKKILKLSWDQFHLIQKRAVERGLLRRSQEAIIPHVGIDEKSFLKGHHYASLATNINKGSVLEVVEGRKREDAKKLLNQDISTEQKDSVLAIAMDMWEADERKQFKSLQADELKVGRAWSIKESFRKFWEYGKEWSARRFFNRWYFWATHSRLAPIIEVAKTLKRHLDGLLAYIIHPITNAVTEGLNSKIQLIKANARGFRNFANYRIAILFHCGKLSLYP
ncbi:MAG: transposase [bacterium]|nr:transposase [bacterium]